MFGKLLVALVTRMNAGLVYFILIAELRVSVHIRFTVTEHSLEDRIGGRGGLSGMVLLQPFFPDA